MSRVQLALRVAPPLKLVLLQGEPDQVTVMDHLGVEVESREQVDTTSRRLTGEGLDTLVENGTTCCYAVQDKVWVHGPGQEPWEVYTVTADWAAQPAGCCT